MNLPRFALYTALAVVTYLMLLQWQEDYPQEIEQAGIAATNISQLDKGVYILQLSNGVKLTTQRILKN